MSVSTSPSLAEPASIDGATYRAMYEASIRDPEAFWGKEAKRIDWIKHFTKVKNTSFTYPDVSIKWFEDGTLNICANCVDRHLKKRGDQVAIIWEPDDPNADARHITYRELYREVNVFANVLRLMGVKRGDRVTIYLPMIPEAASPCSLVRASAPSIRWCSAASRPIRLPAASPICKSKLVITADEGLRGGKKIKLKAQHRRGTDQVARRREAWLWSSARAAMSPCMPGATSGARAAAKVAADCPPEEMERGGSAVHSLYLGVDGKAERRACTPLAATWSLPR